MAIALKEYLGTRMEDRGGEDTEHTGRSLYPIRDTSPGTDMPASNMAFMAPAAIVSSSVKKAVGNSLPVLMMCLKSR